MGKRYDQKILNALKKGAYLVGDTNKKLYKKFFRESEDLILVGQSESWKSASSMCIYSQTLLFIDFDQDTIIIEQVGSKNPYVLEQVFQKLENFMAVNNGNLNEQDSQSFKN